MLDVRLSVGGVSVPVGYAGLEWLLQIIPDSPGFETAYRHLAEMGGVKMRGEIASRENIDTQTVRMLFETGDVYARRALMSNKRAQETLTQQEILQVIAGNDPDSLEDLVSNLGEFTLCDGRPILERLHLHTDPWVRGLIAECPDTPGTILKVLSRDADPDVARKAATMLANDSDDGDLVLNDLVMDQEIDA